MLDAVNLPPAVDPRWGGEITARCAGCGVELVLSPDRHLVLCGHCGTANLVCGLVILPAARLRPSLGAGDLPATVARFARQRDLARIPGIVAHEELWLPYWLPPGGERGGPARAASEPDDVVLAEIDLPRGELEPITATAETDPAWRWPTVAGEPGEVLRWVPFFRVRLAAGVASIDAWIDRVDGGVRTADPLNPSRIRFGRALGALLVAYTVAALGFGLCASSPLVGVIGVAALAGAVWWPAQRLATRGGAGAAAANGRGA